MSTVPLAGLRAEVVFASSTHYLVHINSVLGTNESMTVIVSSNGNTSINFHLPMQLAVSINYGDSQLTVAAAK